MSGSFTMDGANIQSIILILVVIGLGAYVYLEVRKLKGEIASLKKNLQTIPKSSDIPMPSVYPSRFQQPFAKASVPASAQAQASGPRPAPEPRSSSAPSVKSSEPAPEPRPSPEQNMDPVAQEKSLSLPESDIASIEGSTELSNLMMSEEEFDDYDPSYTHGDIDKDEDNIAKDVSIDEKEDIQLFQKPKENPYKGLSVSELKSKLTEMDLPTSGNKSKLVQRILDNE